MEYCEVCGRFIEGYHTDLCDECAESMGLLEPECVNCGTILSAEECNLGQGLCYICLDAMGEI